MPYYFFNFTLNTIKQIIFYTVHNLSVHSEVAVYQVLFEECFTSDIEQTISINDHKDVKYKLIGCLRTNGNNLNENQKLDLVQLR